MKRYRWLWAGTGLLLLSMLVYQVSFTLYHSVFPFPESFGRESRIAAVTSGPRPQVDDGGRLVYIQGNQLILAGASLAADKKLSLPDESLKTADSYKVLNDNILWLSDGELQMSQLQGDGWGPVVSLGKAVAFDAMGDAERLAVALSDDRQIRLQIWEDGRLTAERLLAIQDGAMLRADFSKDGSLQVAVVSDYGTAGQALWWADWDARRNKVLSQLKLYSFQAKEGLVSQFDLLHEQAGVRVICLVKEAHRADGSLLSFVGPFAQNQKIEPRSVKLWEQGKELRIQELGNILVNAAGVEFPVIAGGTVYRAKWEAGERLAAERISAKNGPVAAHPLLFAEDGGSHAQPNLTSEDVRSQAQPSFPLEEGGSRRAAVWVEQGAVSVTKGAGAENWLYGSRTDSAYLAVANRIRWADITSAIVDTASNLSGCIYAVAASLKWLILPYLFLIVRSFLRKRFVERSSWLDSNKQAYWIAVGLYIISKLLMLEQFYSPQILVLLPVWAQASGVRHLLPLAVSGLLLLLCGTVKGKGAPVGSSGGSPGYLPGGSPVARFTRFALIDIGLTAVWFGFFIR